MTHRPLTIRQVVALATLADAAQRCARVRWLTDSGDIVDGTARCFAHYGGGFLGADDDVRDAYLHVSGLGEQWLPISDLIGKVADGTFVVES